MTASRQPASLFGFLNVDKPEGITAHDVVAAVRRILKLKQVGHGGTLDPMATGVLPVAVGKATRLLRFLGGDKTYLAAIKLGLATTTDDITGDTISTSENIADAAEIERALMTFGGVQEQVPPAYSAVHVNGKRLYQLAREGKAPDVVPIRHVTVHKIELVSIESAIVTARITCSAGTYIRSIARDLGQKLGCGATLSALVREAAGPLKLSSAVSLSRLQESAGVGKAGELILRPQQLLELDSLDFSSEQAQQLVQGKSLVLDQAGSCDGMPGDWKDQVHVMAVHGERLIAICRRSIDGAPAFVKIQPEVVFADATS